MADRKRFLINVRQVACSALRVNYRDILFGRKPGGEQGDKGVILFMTANQDCLTNRIAKRHEEHGHFLPASPGFLDSQFAALEPPVSIPDIESAGICGFRGLESGNLVLGFDSAKSSILDIVQRAVSSIHRI